MRQRQHAHGDAVCLRIRTNQWATNEDWGTVIVYPFKGKCKRFYGPSKPNGAACETVQFPTLLKTNSNHPRSQLLCVSVPFYSLHVQRIPSHILHAP